MWKTYVKELNASELVKLVYDNVGGENLNSSSSTSILPAHFLVLLDERLRTMYESMTMFRGKSIFLVGDFLQLPVTAGRDLYQVMYNSVGSNDVKACSLFGKFPVVEI